MHHTSDVIPPRQLTPKERGILEFLLSRPFPGRDQLWRQLLTARVSGDCGCRSLRLSVDRRVTERAQVKRRIPIEAEGVDADGMKIHFLLHVVDGYMLELEIFREDSKPIIELPVASALELFSLDD